MTKQFYHQLATVTTNATGNLYEKATTIPLIANTGSTPIRIDKIMVQVSWYHAAAGACKCGSVVSLTDAAGANFDDSISATNNASMETLLNKWKDNIWLEDFRYVGTSVDESLITTVEMEAATRRIVSPSQSLELSIIASNIASTSISVYALIDVIVWYSPAAQ